MNHGSGEMIASYLEHRQKVDAIMTEMQTRVFGLYRVLETNQDAAGSEFPAPILRKFEALRTQLLDMHVMMTAHKLPDAPQDALPPPPPLPTNNKKRPPPPQPPQPPMAPDDSRYVPKSRSTVK